MPRTWRQLGTTLFGTPLRALITVGVTLILLVTGVFDTLIVGISNGMNHMAASLAANLLPLLIFGLVIAAIIKSLWKGVKPGGSKK